MTIRSMERVVALFALSILIGACGDASTAPTTRGEELVVISVAGIGADAAGIVLRLSGAVERVEGAHPSLEVAWAADDATTATVAVLGPIAAVTELLILGKRAGTSALTVQVIDLTDGDGILSLPATARVVVTGGT